MGKMFSNNINVDYENNTVDIPQHDGSAEGLMLAGTLITATAAEINALDGLTSTVSELNILDGVTSTAAELNILDGVTANAAELNMAADSSANTEVVTAANVIAAAESGSTFILNSATAFASTLPVVAAGLRFRFIVGATIVTGGNHTIVPNAADDNTIYGGAVVAGAEVAASAEGSINLIADLTLPGDQLDVFCDGTNWYVNGHFVTASSLTFTT